MKAGLLALSLVLTSFSLASASVAVAKDYEIDASHSNVHFQIKHLLSKVGGDFKDFKGHLSFDEKKPENAKVDAQIAAASIDTHNEKRDNHLKSEDFFNAEKYPKITFRSTALKKVSDEDYKLFGNTI